MVEYQATATFLDRAYIRVTRINIQSWGRAYASQKAWRVARTWGKLKGGKPKRSERRQTELRRMFNIGDNAINNLTEFFGASRPTVYWVIQPTALANVGGETSMNRA